MAGAAGAQAVAPVARGDGREGLGIPVVVAQEAVAHGAAPVARRDRYAGPMEKARAEPAGHPRDAPAKTDPAVEPSDSLGRAR